jgi:hypothetical protein
MARSDLMVYRQLLPLLRPLNRTGLSAHLLSWEGWHDVDEIQRGGQGEVGPAVPGAFGGFSVGVGGDEGDLGADGDERGDAAPLGAAG